MFDAIEKIQNSVIQHGQYNNRIYLMKIDDGDVPDIIKKLDRLAQEKQYTKIFAKVPLQLKIVFENYGYIQEASVPGFYHGSDEVVFLGKFLSELRSKEKHKKQISTNIELAFAKAKEVYHRRLPPSFDIFRAKPINAEEISKVYRKVFETYPFPIHDSNYITKTMQKNVRYFCILDKSDNNRIVAIASAEMDLPDENVEMTDFATLSEWRGKNFGQQLLARMENEMKKKNIKTAYTIARAMSPGINVTFSKAGYQFGGRLKNNTNISGKIESMNVWYKSLD